MQGLDRRSVDDGTTVCCGLAFIVRYQPEVARIQRQCAMPDIGEPQRINCRGKVPVTTERLNHLLGSCVRERLLSCGIEGG